MVTHASVCDNAMKRREWRAHEEPCPTAEWARQEAEDEAERQYWEESR